MNLVNGTITHAGADYLTQRIATMSPVTVSHFILANIPDIDETTPADADAGLPAAEHIVNGNVPVFRLSYNNHSAVVYSIVLGSGEGDYDFNYYGAVTDTGVLLAYCHIPLVKKRAGLGQLLNRNMLITFSAAQALTGADIPAEAWQFDFSEALADAIVSVTGPGLVYAGTTNTYSITDYDQFSVYSVATNTGTASISGSSITLSLPAGTEAGICALDITRAGTTRRINIAIGAMSIAKPSTVTPVNGATGVIERPTFSLSAFTTYPAGSDTLQSSSVRVFNAANGQVWESTKPAGQQHVMPADILQEGALYRWQGKHTGNTLGDSEWSELASFTTAQSFFGIGTVLPDGGIVFAQQGGDWLVCAPATMRAVRKWGLYNTDTVLPNNPSPDPNTGRYNTDILTSSQYSSINDGHGSIGAPAAEYARSQGYDLPNREELAAVWNNRALIDAADVSGGSATLATIGADSSVSNAWTSTEQSTVAAFCQAFGQFGTQAENKSSERWVVSIRRIPI